MAASLSFVLGKTYRRRASKAYNKEVSSKHYIVLTLFTKSPTPRMREPDVYATPKNARPLKMEDEKLAQDEARRMAQRDAVREGIERDVNREIVERAELAQA